MRSISSRSRGPSSRLKARTRSAPGSQELLADKIIDQLGEVGIHALDGNIEFAADRNANLVPVASTVTEFPGPRPHPFEGVVAPVGETQQDDGVGAPLAEDLRMWTKDLILACQSSSHTYPRSLPSEPRPLALVLVVVVTAVVAVLVAAGDAVAGHEPEEAKSLQGRLLVRASRSWDGILIY
jgi:hypothetical protein